MDSTTGYNSRFRSISLPQRDEMMRVWSGGASSGTSRERSSEAERGMRDAEPTRTHRRSSTRDTSRRRDTEGRSRRDGRSERRRTSTLSQEFFPDHEPLRESVSAYAGESGVVSVSRRGERPRSARGFSLVPDAPSTGKRFRSDRHDSFSDRAPMATGRSHRVAWDELDDLGWQEDLHPRGSRRVSAAVTYAPRRGVSAFSALREVPGAIGGAFLSLLGHVRGLLVVAIAALLAWMLYAPARDLYVANRRLDELQATYDALLAENESIRSELESLQTREGIENEARARGYVLPGETKVVVEGLPEEHADDAAAEAVADIEIPDTRPWYTRMLDTAFGYEPES